MGLVVHGGGHDTPGKRGFFQQAGGLGEGGTGESRRSFSEGAKDKTLAIVPFAIPIKPQLPDPLKPLSDAGYIRLANFCHALRRFLDSGENAAPSQGLTPQQHQAVRVIRANLTIRSTVGYLA